jgi:hypothetical protein
MEGLDPQFRILAVPQRLRPPFPFPYPAHQRGMMIEEFVAWRLASMAAPGGEPTWEPAWTYVPIFWTSYACQLSTAGRFARWRGWRALAHWLDDNLHSGVSYFTVSQHDDGLSQRGLVTPPQPILEWSCGGHGDFALPLVCDRHEPIRCRRDIRASFVGALGNEQNRYPCRQAMVEALRGHEEYVVIDAPMTWSASDLRSAADTRRFVELMCRSVFALCPRGYGRTSYRMYEAMQLGCIPVYIYDEPWLPYTDELDWSQFAVLVHVADAPRLHDILASISSQQIAAMQRRIAEIHDAYFTLPGVVRQLFRRMRTMRPVSQHPRQAAAA